MGNHARPQTFYFDYELERGDHTMQVEVTYGCDDDEVYLESVKHNGYELITTANEDRMLEIEAQHRLSDDIADEEASYGDYVRDLRRDEDY